MKYIDEFSQSFALLINFCCNPSIYKMNQTKFYNRFTFLKKLSNTLRFHVIDEEILWLAHHYKLY